MPKGPWLHPCEGGLPIPEDLKAWCCDTALCGGGWGVSVTGHHLPSTRRGPQKTIGCRTGQIPNSKSASCKWSVTIERCVEGWGVWAYHEHGEGCPHNHALAQSVQEANAHACMRSIPQDLAKVDMAKKLVNTVRPNQAHRTPPCS